MSLLQSLRICACDSIASVLDFIATPFNCAVIYEGQDAPHIGFREDPDGGWTMFAGRWEIMKNGPWRWARDEQTGQHIRVQVARRRWRLRLEWECTEVRDAHPQKF